MILIVGDKPSDKNISKDIPFVGTVSYKNLLDWLYQMNVDISNVVLANRIDLEVLNKDVYTRSHIFRPTRVLALGRFAAKSLEKKGLNFFELPHPSGRNFKLNDKGYLRSILSDCSKYLEEEKVLNLEITHESK